MNLKCISSEDILYTSSHFAGGISGNFISEMFNRPAAFRLWTGVESRSAVEFSLKLNVRSDSRTFETKLKSAQTSLLSDMLKLA